MKLNPFAHGVAIGLMRGFLLPGYPMTPPGISLGVYKGSLPG